MLKCCRSRRFLTSGFGFSGHRTLKKLRLKVLGCRIRALSTSKNQLNYLRDIWCLMLAYFFRNIFQNFGRNVTSKFKQTSSLTIFFSCPNLKSSAISTNLWSTLGISLNDYLFVKIMHCLLFHELPCGKFCDSITKYNYLVSFIPLWNVFSIFIPVISHSRPVFDVRLICLLSINVIIKFCDNEYLFLLCFSFLSFFSMIMNSIHTAL